MWFWGGGRTPNPPDVEGSILITLYNAGEQKSNFEKQEKTCVIALNIEVNGLDKQNNFFLIFIYLRILLNLFS